MGRAVPRRLEPALRRLAGRLRAPFYRGDAVECPCCGGRFRSFLPGGVRRREGVRCPRCDSLERHRLLWLFLEQCTDLLTTPQRVLHVAPEPQIGHRLAALPHLEYVSADLDSPLAQERIDVTDIPYPDGHFKAVICCHVLEHVPDDRRAMRELRRVLAEDGWAILQTPVHVENAHTIEDPGITDPEERRRRFGQPDHVRIYGRDFTARLAEAGFRVHRDPFARRLGAETRRRHGLRRSERVLVCVPSTRRPNKKGDVPKKPRRRTEPRMPGLNGVS